jgi:hypothetical protein
LPAYASLAGALLLDPRRWPDRLVRLRVLCGGFVG